MFMNCGELESISSSELSSIVPSSSDTIDQSASHEVAPIPIADLMCPIQTLNPSLKSTPSFNSKKKISSISLNGSIEIYWDWEVLRDKGAPDLKLNKNLAFNSNSIDGPPRFYKTEYGEKFAILPMSISYRSPIGANDLPSRALTSSDIVFDSSKTSQATNGKYNHKGHGSGWFSGNCSEADYDNQMWIYGLWSSDGVKFDALAHHEFYPKTCPTATTSAWVNSIHHLTSTDSGATFSPKPYVPYYETGKSNSDRLVIIPKPSGYVNQEPLYNFGFYHPSNIVKEGEFYYAIVMINMLTGRIKTNGTKKEALVNGGFAMIRTKNTSVPGGWDIYSNRGWHKMSAGGYIGMGGYITPKIFLEHKSNSPYSDYPAGGQNMTYSLVQHQETGQWVAFGYSNQGATTVSYSLTDSLHTPKWGAITPVIGAPSIPAMGYPSIASQDSPGYVFQFIDNEPYLYFMAPNREAEVPGTLLNYVIKSGLSKQKPHVDFKISNNLASRSIWRVKLKVKTK